ncbi:MULTISPECIES: MGMT family protein [Prochlorococcus]|uniref:MGMT family protein n=1 Tax=Prochlorococcus TaxID=1218 RepID=UPI0007B3F370|nr:MULTISPECIES: methylated-DNA--[protein]-cysteine S-methyltransferase [Prochlorococcus]KZR66924.1 Methylated-DNA--protein-cysteine methyltransferase [Prochlorococcus marinus str. MIT 1312]KZR81549.1 Methylated-DNA--protein-cysteine methyltransferase [Prochlorococcus marinus str. MIT 1327]NMO83065.1 methylated-DNA--[protein]-cysteine S-methyltransferase [Prochlorococcus sp. P1344]NMP05736.1 methylated-DNA--[protein]-cysteine S-methyltransferase [Prochlorococcus sp. P1361]NMP13424.1 methylated
MGQASFDLRVWDAVSLIPFGQLAIYGQIAEMIGAYGCARQVGWAMRRLPLPSKVPWHRVVNAKGMISMSLSREGSDWMQRQMLIAEGILVDAEGHLPLRRYLWRPQLSDQGLLLGMAQEGVSSGRFISAQDNH